MTYEFGLVRGETCVRVRKTLTLEGFSDYDADTGRRAEEYLRLSFTVPEDWYIEDHPYTDSTYLVVPASDCEVIADPRLWVSEKGKEYQTSSLVGIVASYSDRIQNGRTKQTICDAIVSEVFELREEVDFDGRGKEAGPDGIFGECIDIIASTLDLIRLEYPDMPVEELERKCADYLRRKCDKWERKYG